MFKVQSEIPSTALFLTAANRAEGYLPANKVNLI